MLSRFVPAIALLVLLGGCVATPRFEMSQQIDFNATPHYVPPILDYTDLACCGECRA
jgi:hypothetical protein